MAKRVSPEAALLMLHWQNSVCDPKGVWGKNLCRQIEKNNAIKNAQGVLATARNRGMLTIFVNIGWRPGFPELPENQYYPLLQGAKDENKGIVGTWEVDVIDALRPMSNEPIVINFGSDSFEGTDLDRLLRANNIGHLFVSGVTSEGPADRAGLKRGDVILGVNGEPVSHLPDFYRKLYAQGDAGTVIPLDVLRDKDRQRVEVKSINRLDHLRLKSSF